MKITLKTVILVALVVFNLVIIFSNFTNYEGLENKTEDSLDKDQVSKIKTHISDIRRTVTNMENILYSQKDGADKKDSSDKESPKKRDKKP